MKNRKLILELKEIKFKKGSHIKPEFNHISIIDYVFLIFKLNNKLK